MTSNTVTESNRHYLNQLKSSSTRTIDLSSIKNSYTNHIMNIMAYVTPEDIDMMFKITVEAILLSAIDSNGSLNDAFGGLLEYEMKQYRPDIDKYLSIPVGDMYSEGLELYNTMYDLILSKSKKYKPVIYNWLDSSHVIVKDGGVNMNEGSIVMLDIPDILSMFIAKYNIDTTTETFMVYIDNIINGTKQISHNTMLDTNVLIEEAVMDFKEVLTTKEAVNDFVAVYDKVIQYFMTQFIIIGVLNEVIYLDNVANNRIMFKFYKNIHR